MELWRRQKVEEKTGKKQVGPLPDIAEGHFPKPVRLGPNSVAWVASEVEEWIRERIAERDEGERAA